ncbi:MAG TPA: FecR domain-containing protein [Polyangia bacterium]
MNDLFSRLGQAQDQALRADLTLPAPRRWLGAPPARRRISLAGFGAMALAGALAVGAAVTLFVMSPRQGTMTVVAGALRVETRATLAATDVDVPLHFSDGSRANLLPGSRGRVLSLAPQGAEVELLDGGLSAHVVHADRTRWVFRAGPFSVLVTGTRFDLRWSEKTQRLSVALHEGGVTVDGAVLGAGLPLRAGQELSVALNEGSVRVEAVSARESLSDASNVAPVELPAADDEAAPVVGEPVREDHAGWRALAERGAHAEAWRVARRIGIDNLSQRLEPAGLLALADVARYVGATDESREVFLSLVKRFPRHALTGDAVFSLGRLASDAGDTAAATMWFARYRRGWPNGALVAEATGRLLEAALAGDDAVAAKRAAEDYLERAPTGPFAALARKVLTTTAVPASR